MLVPVCVLCGLKFNVYYVHCKILVICILWSFFYGGAEHAWHDWPPLENSSIRLLEMCKANKMSHFTLQSALQLRQEQKPVNMHTHTKERSLHLHWWIRNHSGRHEVNSRPWRSKINRNRCSGHKCDHITRGLSTWPERYLCTQCLYASMCSCQLSITLTLMSSDTKWTKSHVKVNKSGIWSSNTLMNHLIQS